MKPSLIEIALRDPEQIMQEIIALETEVNNDLSVGKKSYAANCIRLDIARLQRDVQILAEGVKMMGEFFEKLEILVDEQMRIANLQDVMQSCLANNVRILRKFMKKEEEKTNEKDQK